MIRLEHLYKTIGDQEILKDLSLEIRSEEIFVLIGRSGVGKSVTLKHIVGLMEPDEGKITVDGIEMRNASPQELHQIRSRIGLVFQSGALVNWLSVEENIALPLRETLRLPPEEIEDRVADSLRRVHLQEHGHKMPSDLSGGMKKRVGIARAIATKPKILLYDEPTSGLDPVTAQAMDELILETRASTRATSVVVSHDLMSVFRIADRIGLIDAGKMVAIGPPDEFRNHPDSRVQAFLESGLAGGETRSALRRTASLESERGTGK